MKITPAMAEAGINALAKGKRSKLSDEAFAASIYSAMDNVRRSEEARARPHSAPAAVYEHQSWPAWWYGPDGESKLFQKAEDVPDGWTDSVQVHVLARDADVLSGKLDRKLKRKVTA